MASLSDYYKDLLIWESIPHTELVYAWDKTLISKIEKDFRSSIQTKNIIGLKCSIITGSTNQSIGNQVEEHSMPVIALGIKGFSLSKCSGAGYPDQLLTELSSALRIPLEVKATSDWNPNDSNRRVLTSSSEKIRKQFSEPIHHLLFTLLYKIETGLAVIEHMRLDFLEPTTPVSVRLEASINHKILSHGTPASFVI